MEYAILFVVIFASVVVAQLKPQSHSLIDVTGCSRYYNATTSTPDQQIESLPLLLKFRHLLENCSESTTILLCSFYIPYCSPNHPEYRVQPCRRLCRQVKSSCVPVLLESNESLPINCNSLPKPKSSVICMQPPRHKHFSVFSSSFATPTSSAPASTSTTPQFSSLGTASIITAISARSLSPSTTQVFFSSSLSLLPPSPPCRPDVSSPNSIYFYTTILLAFFACILLAITIISCCYFKRRLAAALHQRYRVRFIPDQLAEPLAVLESINQLPSTHPSSAPSTPSTLTPSLPPRFDLEL